MSRSCLLLPDSDSALRESPAGSAVCRERRRPDGLGWSGGDSNPRKAIRSERKGRDGERSMLWAPL